ncbi:hypothetical protein AB1Y20_003987 [Prymnesium parvum]|uniref:Ammonium transporter AmtB-like domain-containing protein n=1 Tax=Prymnesium parvum TaxID=97485 RepID=A0AB34J9B1_PRYPA
MASGELEARHAELEAKLALLSNTTAELRSATNTSWVLSSVALVVLMQLGFAMLESGSVRSHNVIATYMKNLLDFVVGTSVACTVGYYIAYGVHPLAIVGDRDTGEPELFLFHVAFQATAATIVSGAMAERTTIGAYTIVAAAVSTVYCVGVRFTWGGGWMSEMGFHDFAGAGVVHMFGGTAALVGAWLLGPRLGRWDASMQGDFVPHNISSLIGGTILLLVGWLGFNPGSSLGLADATQQAAAASAAMVTVIAASAAALFETLVSLVASRGTCVDVLGFCNALLAGLVAITSGCDAMDAPGAIATGVLAVFAYHSAVRLLKFNEIDDVVEAFAVHGASGLWGCIATGLFHRHDGLLTAGRGDLLGYQLLGCTVLAGLSVGTTLVTAGFLNRIGWLRVTTEQEITGLDHEFGLTAYVQKSQALRHCAGVSIVLRENGYTAEDLLTAIKALKHNIYKPFTPQAACKKLEGEVLDIMNHFEFSNLGSVKHLAFLSHHKADAGDAARIFFDNIKRLLETSACDRIRNSESVRSMEEKDVVFLDSTDLKLLSQLVEDVSSSANYILMLSRQTLQRPWVLVELCTAMMSSVNIQVVLIEYPGKHNDPKTFRFPDDLDSAIADWEGYIASSSKQDQNSVEKTPKFLRKCLRRRTAGDQTFGTGTGNRNRKSIRKSVVLRA